MTLTDDRLAPTYIPSSLTTVPAWHPRLPGLRSNDLHELRYQQAARRELMVYVQGARLPRWFDDHLNVELNRLFALPAGWDGFSADEVTVEAVAETVAVLASIVNESTVAPQFFPLADGGIQIEWHVGGNDIEIEINGAGSVYVLATRSTGETVADAEIRTSGDDAIMRSISGFANELSARLGLAHLLGDIYSPGGCAAPRRRRPQYPR